MAFKMSGFSAFTKTDEGKKGGLSNQSPVYTLHDGKTRYYKTEGDEEIDKHTYNVLLNNWKEKHSKKYTG